MTTRPMLHEEVTSIILPTPIALNGVGHDAWNQALVDADAKKGQVVRLEAFLDQREALQKAHQWRMRATRQLPVTRTAKVFKRTLKFDGIWINMHVLVVREKVA